MAKIIKKGIFPSQAVSSAEKASEQYGLQIGNAIEAEWFRKEKYNQLRANTYESIKIVFDNLDLV